MLKTKELIDAYEAGLEAAPNVLPHANPKLQEIAKQLSLQLQDMLDKIADTDAPCESALRETAYFNTYISMMSFGMLNGSLSSASEPEPKKSLIIGG